MNQKPQISKPLKKSSKNLYWITDVDYLQMYAALMSALSPFFKTNQVYTLIYNFLCGAVSISCLSASSRGVFFMVSLQCDPPPPNLAGVPFSLILYHPAKTYRSNPALTQPWLMGFDQFSVFVPLMSETLWVLQ